MIKITAIGGYSEVGRNMTLVQYNEEAVILDMGIHLENYIRMKGDDDLELFTKKELIRADAIPDDDIIHGLRENVRAIIPSHGHLDHMGAIPFMAQKYDAPVICTPYTASVIRAILKDKARTIPNEIVSAKLNSKVKISDSMAAEFIEMTHSIPHAALVVLHTPEGKIAYSNDFKLDNTPTFGNPPNYSRIRSIGKKEVRALVIDSLYAGVPKKTPSESIAREMLKDVLLNMDSRGKAVIVTTFSSHIARLKSIVEIGRKMKRKIVFLGRSLGKYVYAAEDIGLVKFSGHVKICNFKKQIAKELKDIEGHRGDYLIVCTGHQAEPDAVLSKIADDSFSFRLRPDDHVIFSCTTIPSEMNLANMAVLEEKLKGKKARIFKDIHVSGHAAREDHREFIRMLNPEHIIPGHGGRDKTVHMVELAEEMGYERGKTVHALQDGMILEI